MNRPAEHSTSGGWIAALWRPASSRFLLGPTERHPIDRLQAIEADHLPARRLDELLAAAGKHVDQSVLDRLRCTVRGAGNDPYAATDGDVRLESVVEPAVTGGGSANPDPSFTQGVDSARPIH